VLDDLGSAVVGGEFPTGHTTSVEALTARTLASRSIVREATRVLASLGLLTASPRVGLVVQPPRSWNLLDPAVIRWRLQGPDRARQVAELRELRAAVEPAAAVAAARRVGGTAAARRLLHVATAFEDPDVLGDPARFLRADAELHSAVLDASGNAMFVRLGAVIGQALEDRAGIVPVPRDVELHTRLARAIAAGDETTAGAAVRELVARTAYRSAEVTTETSGA
jgi:DNA-binding FadR family transcriptional regulator